LSSKPTSKAGVVSTNHLRAAI